MASNQDSTSVYKDLIQFLQAPRMDLKMEATKAVLQVVSDRDEVLRLVEHGALLPLLRIASDASDPTCAENALQALLYLSSSTDQATNQCIDELLQNKAVPRLVELVLGSTRSQHKQVNFALGLLANLTRTEQGALELVGKTLPDYAVKEVDEKEMENRSRPTMELLLDRYFNLQYIIDVVDYAALEPYEWDTLDKDPYQHFAAILMNATQVKAGRQFVMRIPKQKDDEPAQSVLERLLPQLQTSNPIRRRGISGMVRNVCLEIDAAWWLLNQLKLTSHILYPLAGPEELDLDEKTGMDPDLWLQGPDKAREVDTTTRLHLVEAILLLCATGRRSRETLRLARTYVILKYCDMTEEDEPVSERINECVQYLRRDEEGTEEGSSDNMVEEATRKRLQLTMASTQVGSKSAADYDDVD
ncbi:unnamed protein product [Cylindrotheca closterium]|uniref:Protein HGH1 homolog n=1 Tax=Cylindrotheca closterium TaxID=2856 RepID=A0AAD2PX17_9STRA|nr:unnamed protein product [Cylindrotheca closterium]